MVNYQFIKKVLAKIGSHSSKLENLNNISIHQKQVTALTRRRRGSVVQQLLWDQLNKIRIQLREIFQNSPLSGYLAFVKGNDKIFKK